MKEFSFTKRIQANRRNNEEIFVIPQFADKSIVVSTIDGFAIGYWSILYGVVLRLRGLFFVIL